MYLFSELQRELVHEPVQLSVGKNPFPLTRADEIAQRSIGSLLKDLQEGSSSYNPNTTLLDEHRWGSTLWAVAAATHHLRVEHWRSPETSPGLLPLDELALNLIRGSFIRNFGLGGGVFYREEHQQGSILRKKIQVPISLEAMLNTLNQWEWNSAPKTGRYTREKRFLLGLAPGRTERLSFVGELKTESENPRIAGEIARISGVQLTGTMKDGPLGDAARAVSNDLKPIIRDQVKRSTLADRYGAVLETVALSDLLQDLFQQTLATGGVELPEEAMEALAFGRFPFDRMRYYGSSLDLVFLRGCTRCRYPTKFLLEAVGGTKPERMQRRAAAQITEEILTPWHAQSCGKTPDELWRGRRLEDEGYEPQRIGREWPSLKSFRSSR